MSYDVQWLRMKYEEYMNKAKDEYIYMTHQK